VLADGAQAFLDCAPDIGADHRHWAAYTGLNGIGAGLLGGILLTHPASPGGPQQPGARIGAPGDVGEHMRPRPTGQRRRCAQVIIGQRLRRAQKAARAVGQRPPLRRIHPGHLPKSKPESPGAKSLAPGLYCSQTTAVIDPLER